MIILKSVPVGSFECVPSIHIFDINITRRNHRKSFSKITILYPNSHLNESEQYKVQTSISTFLMINFSFVKKVILFKSLSHNLVKNILQQKQQNLLHLELPLMFVACKQNRFQCHLNNIDA